MRSVYKWIYYFLVSLISLDIYTSICAKLIFAACIYIFVYSLEVDTKKKISPIKKKVSDYILNIFNLRDRILKFHILK